MQEYPYKIYNASAGSGKTFVLVKEYLKLVLSGGDPRSFRQVLAITFTNKAVNEMKERILDSLYLFGQGDLQEQALPLFNAIVQELGISPAILRTRSRQTLKNILHNYAFFDVSTIDKFTHRLIRTFAGDLKLPQNFEVVLDTDLLLEETVSRLLSRVGSNKELTKVLIDFAIEKIDDDRSWDLAIDLNNIGKLLFNENHTPHLKKVSGLEIGDFLEFKTKIVKEIKEIEQKAIIHAQTALKLIEHSNLEITDFPRETLPNHFKKIIASEFDPARLYKNKLEENLASGKILKASKKLPTETFASQLFTTYLQIKELLYQRAFLTNIYKNLVPLTVLNALQKEQKLLEQDHDLLPISSFNTIISNEIRDQPAPFIYERLGEKYRHYFMDEFQDTSEMQWQNLIPLISNALDGVDEQGRKGSLLLVGDAKQAIYRWRGGRAEQFLNLININTNPFVIEPSIENLPSNYRSHEQIIAFNNDFFTSTSPVLNNSLYNRLFVEGNRQVINDKKGGVVQIDFIEKETDSDTNDSYCSRVLTIIEKLTGHNFQFQDICILTRKKDQGVLLADFLMRQNIPIISSESLLLANSPAVAFLINLLKYCAEPGNLEHSYNILVYLGKERGNIHDFILKYLGNLDEYLTATYAFDIRNLKEATVYDGLELAIRQFQLALNSGAYLQCLLDEVLVAEQKLDSGIMSFLEYWDRNNEKLSVIVPENVNAVQIITIHKAKGLEFPIVLFPFANTDIYAEKMPKLWLPNPLGTCRGFDEVLISKKKEVMEYGAVAASSYDEEQHKLELDAFNLLYVALTRAVYGLYIITEKEQGSEQNTNRYSGLFMNYLLQKGLWESERVSYTFGALGLKENTSVENKRTNIPYLYSYKEQPSFRIITRSGMLWDTELGGALAKGNLLHNIMGLIRTKDDIDEALEQFIIAGDSTVSELSELRDTVLKIVDHPELSAFFTTEYTIKNERDILTANGLILRPDRLMIKENKVSILDYKTGKADARYHEQLQAYANALKTMGYEIAHKIIVYIDKTITTEFI